MKIRGDHIPRFTYFLQPFFHGSFENVIFIELIYHQLFIDSTDLLVCLLIIIYLLVGKQFQKKEKQIFCAVKRINLSMYASS